MNFNELARRARKLEQEHLKDGCRYAEAGVAYKCDELRVIRAVAAADETLAAYIPEGSDLLKALENCVRV